MANYAHQLAALAVRLDPAAAPPRVQQYLKYLIADSLACALGGAQMVVGERAAEVLHSAGAVAVPGLKAGRSLLDAVYLGAFNANLLDYDDTYDGHPGCTIVPPALAIAQAEGATGAEFLAAVLAGYECSMRVADSVKPTPERLRLVRGITTWHIFGAAVTAARLLGFNQSQTACAIASAAISAPVPAARISGFTTGRTAWLKNNMGLGAWAGVLGALTVRSGFRMETDVFEGEAGFATAMSSDRFRPVPVNDGRFMLEKISLKPYPACRFIHPVIDALRDLVAKGVRAEQVEAVLVSTFYEVADYFVFVPRDAAEMAFSLPYIVAMVLTERPMPHGWYWEANLSDPQVVRIMATVSAEIWSEAEAGYAAPVRELMSRVQVRVAGREEITEVRIPWGDPRNPMLEQDLIAKFTGLVAPVVGAARADEAWERIMGLEAEPDLTRLARLLAPTSAADRPRCPRN